MKTWAPAAVWALTVLSSISWAHGTSDANVGDRSGEPAVDPFPEETPDQCSQAIPLAVGDNVTGSTVGASPEMVDSCGKFIGDNVTGVWYMLEGTGGALEAIVAADYDMQFAVFLGSCDEPLCVDGTYGDAFPWTNGQIGWLSETGVMYYILVAGWESEVGTFHLAITDGQVPPNSDCASAITITLGESVDGTTEFAGIPAENDFPICTLDEVFVGITAPNVWYQFQGTGSIVQFSLFADYDAKISIYQGESCDALTCWNYNDDSPIAGPQSLMVQPLDAGTMYFINVHGFEKSYGSFTLESEQVEPAPNNECSGATPLELGTMVQSDTLAATGDPDLPFCGKGSNETNPGIWYSAIGTGNTMQLSLNDTLKLHISVYTGGCDGLTCADSRFFGAFPLVWDTVEGEEYWIYVYGREHALSDTFGILIEEVQRPENDKCPIATPLEAGDVLAGTTKASSTEEGLEYCGDVDALGQFFGGVWYTFQGTGETLLVGVSIGIDGESLFDTVVRVYSGGCDALVCVDGNDQGEEFEEYENAILVDTVAGDTYHAFVQGFGLSAGDFEIALMPMSRPENDECTAAPILALGDDVEASTQLATLTDDVDFVSCGTSRGGNFSAPGIWYSVEGGGFPVQASIFGQYSIQLTVFNGTCDALECVDGTEGNEGDYFNGQVIWGADEGVIYYILVHGFTGATGDFELFYETAIF